MDTKSIDHLLTTTRSVRKRLDLSRPVDPKVIQQCIDLAIQAPDGGNLGKYHFLVITDEEKRAKIGNYYRQSFEAYLAVQKQNYAERIYDSAAHLAEHFGEVPVHIITCTEGRVETGGPMMQAARYGSVLPATWSLMLALRSRGVGAAWTTLHLAYEKEIAALLGIPDHITQGALLPVAYYTGDDFKPGKRIPAIERTYWDSWSDTRS
ncbi:MAG: nitroreductase [Gammaproteobacteria bacterium]|jgi:nitroreductase